MNGILILFITGILVTCLLASLAVFRYFYTRQRAVHEQIIREQYLQELEFSSHIAGEALHQNVLNRQIRPVFKQLRTLQQKSDPFLQKALQNIIEQLEVAETKIRHISNEIYPPHLTEMFAETCQHAVRTLALSHEYTGKIDIKIEGEFQHLEEIQMFGLYSLIDLFVSNSLNHADATEIQVQLQQKPQKISLLMRDNGKGFDMKKARKMDSRGLGDFRSRAISIAVSASTFDYYSIPDSGTFFEMEIPHKHP